MTWLLAKRRLIPSDITKYPYGNATIEKSHENSKGTNQDSEETFPEKIYPYETSSGVDRHEEDAEYDRGFEKYLGRPGRDYESVWPISTSLKKKQWLKIVV